MKTAIKKVDAKRFENEISKIINLLYSNNVEFLDEYYIKEIIKGISITIPKRWVTKLNTTVFHELENSCKNLQTMAVDMFGQYNLIASTYQDGVDVFLKDVIFNAFNPEKTINREEHKLKQLGDEDFHSLLINVQIECEKIKLAYPSYFIENVLQWGEAELPSYFGHVKRDINEVPANLVDACNRLNDALMWKFSIPRSWIGGYVNRINTMNYIDELVKWFNKNAKQNPNNKH